MSKLSRGSCITLASILNTKFKYFIPRQKQFYHGMFIVKTSYAFFIYRINIILKNNLCKKIIFEVYLQLYELLHAKNVMIINEPTLLYSFWLFNAVEVMGTSNWLHFNLYYHSSQILCTKDELLVRPQIVHHPYHLFYWFCVHLLKECENLQVSFFPPWAAAM